MKTFGQLKGSLLETTSKVKPLVGKSKEELIKLHYSKFPVESDPDLKDIPFKDRMTILSARDAVFAASKDVIQKDNAKVGRAAFKASGAMVGDYTTMGLVSKITKDGVIFDAGNEVKFSAKLAVSGFAFDGIKKVAKGTLTKKKNAQKKARDAGMEDFANRYRLD